METVKISKDQNSIAPQNKSNPRFQYELIARSNDIEIKNGRENYPQGCAFSPDGLCILTTTIGDSKLRLYNTPSSVFSSGNKCKDTADDDDNTHEINEAEDTNLSDAPQRTSNTILAIHKETNETTEKVEKWNAALTSSGGDSVRSYAW